MNVVGINLYAFLYNPGSSDLSVVSVLNHTGQYNSNTCHPPVDKVTKWSVPFIYFTKFCMHLLCLMHAICQVHLISHNMITRTISYQIIK